ncbi:carbon storage regulator CsrA [Rubripirellula amarantea]|uniref:Translational regulator CsrA n=1 Tax=Rubripirellula amarantea TaxID=2527999 RepID=A0A5C5WJ95_9BACT|nr:carbon storage regulator CsrA [Rubripirellula amarantea]MDA8744402.1 carbon storage regulator CsrA [Rubripirellula amarantea]TWT50838.1 hypothetical protein Pla22_35810 [Rubripirellula amarantea]
MLVLSRKADESIQIGNDIVIKVIRVQGNRVRLAIEAPKEIRVVRGELEKLASETQVVVKQSGLDLDPLVGALLAVSATAT